MQGTVKWFSEEKGYGFIIDGTGVDHHFHVSDVRGAALPRTGAQVSFEPQASRRGPKARQVTLVPGEEAPPAARRDAGRHDDRVLCTGCDRRMVPRIITGPPIIRPSHGWTPVPKRSICAFCGATYKKFPLTNGEKIGVAIFFAVAAVILSVIASHAM
jgi:cold shock CspA family protein